MSVCCFLILQRGRIFGSINYCWDCINDFTWVFTVSSSYCIHLLPDLVSPSSAICNVLHCRRQDICTKLSYSMLWATWRAWRRGSWCSESYKQQVSKRATAATTSWLLYPMDGGLAIGLLPTACCKYYHGLYCTYCVLRASMFCSFSLPPPHSLSFPFNSISIVHFIWFVGGLKLHLTKEKERNECRTVLVLVPVVMPWPHRTVAPPSVVFGQFWIPRNNRK